MALRCLAFVVALWFAIGQECPAASLLELQLFPDGSFDPPGDRLDVTVAFRSDESRVTLEVLAMLVSGEGRSTIQRVKARGGIDRDDAGLFDKSATLRKPSDSAVATVTVVIPYAGLALPLGDHQLAYEVRGFVNGQLQFVKPTRLTGVKVTERTRKQLTVTTSQAGAEVEFREVDAYELSDKPVAARVTLKATKYGTREQQTTHAVDIPGEFIRSELGHVSKGIGDESQAWMPLEELRPKHERTVCFATNRAATDKGDFGSALADAVRYGTCIVNVPVDSHRRGALEIAPETQNWWKQFDPAKFFYVYDIRTLAKEQFRQDLSQQDVLLYIHGFNTTFRHAILTAAQLKHDLEFPGHVAAFTWPSEPAGAGLLSGYRSAEGRATASIEAVIELLDGLLAQRGSNDAGPQIHIVAHSLGNRILLDAVHRLVTTQRIKPESRVFANVVLAAADVDWPTFALQAPSLVGCTRRVTYYYSTIDFALQLSKSLHGGKLPIGLSPLFRPDVDTINADRVNEMAVGFGHRYFSSSNPLLVDLNLLVVGGLVPDKRQPPLGNKQAIAGYTHWEFVAPP